MISVSSDYKNYISNNTSVSAQNKIVVDGVEYLGNVLKTYPKISHSASKVCGSFPAKTVSFEIYDLTNSLDFEGKEITVYKGLMLNGSPYYVKQGVFIPQKNNITTDISSRSIKFEKVQDRTQLLDELYESELDWTDNQTHTGLEIVQEICTKKNLTLKSNNFAWASYAFYQPNFPSNVTYREVIARLAEIGGETVIFDYNGYLEFKSQYTTGDTIGRTRFGNLSKEKTITINSIVLGKEGINDDIKYPVNMSDPDRVSLRIEDNPYVDLRREEMISDVASHIIGLTYVPFNVSNLLDGFIYELNDVISITDRNNETLRAVLLTIENSSRIQSNVKLDDSNKDTTDYNLAGSQKGTLAGVRLDVDHIKNEIRSIVSKTEELDIEYNGRYEYQITRDTAYEDNKNYFIKEGLKYVEFPQYGIYTGERTGNPSELELYEEIIQVTYELTEDQTFDASTTYYELVNDEYVEYTGPRTGNPSELELYEKIEEIIGYQSTQDTSFIEDKSYYEKNYDIGDSIPSDTIYEYIYINGLEENVGKLQDDYTELSGQIQSKANTGTIETIQTNVQELQTNTYKKWQVQEIANGNGYFTSDDEQFGNVDYYTKNNDTYTLYTGPRTGSPKNLGLYEYGVISAVVSTEAKFSRDGMEYAKNNAKSKSIINQNGLDVSKIDRDGQQESEEEVLFAGYVEDNRFDITDGNDTIKEFKGQSIVYANNFMSKEDTVLGSHCIIRDYDDGTGWFVI